MASVNNEVSSEARFAVERRLGDGSVGRLGTVRLVDGLYFFNPNVSGRKPSRKGHRCMADALPRWVGYPHACETRRL